jgi:hypothetical protein
MFLGHARYGFLCAVSLGLFELSITYVVPAVVVGQALRAILHIWIFSKRGRFLFVEPCPHDAIDFYLGRKTMRLSPSIVRLAIHSSGIHRHSAPLPQLSDTASSPFSTL